MLLRIILASTSVHILTIFAKPFLPTLSHEDSKLFLKRSKRWNREHAGKESDECYFEETKCSYEKYAERGENMYSNGKEVFGKRGLKFFSKRRINYETQTYWERNYNECPASMLQNTCKVVMDCFLKRYSQTKDRIRSESTCGNKDSQQLNINQIEIPIAGKNIAKTVFNKTVEIIPGWIIDDENSATESPFQEVSDYANN